MNRLHVLYLNLKRAKKQKQNCNTCRSLFSALHWANRLFMYHVDRMERAMKIQFTLNENWAMQSKNEREKIVSWSTSISAQIPQFQIHLAHTQKNRLIGFFLSLLLQMCSMLIIAVFNFIYETVDLSLARQTAQRWMNGRRKNEAPIECKIKHTHVRTHPCNLYLLTCLFGDYESSFHYIGFRVRERERELKWE